MKEGAENMPKQKLPNLASSTATPSNLCGEMAKYQELFTNMARTITGVSSFTSLSSGYSYSTSDYPDDSDVYNKGQDGLCNLLYKYVLKDYIVDVDEFNDIESKVSYITSYITKDSIQDTSLIYTNGVLTKVVEYQPDGITLKQEIGLTYTNNILTSVETKQYNASGILDKTITEILNYTNKVLTSIERVVA